jgi:hypothetical protein
MGLIGLGLKARSDWFGFQSTGFWLIWSGWCMYTYQFWFGFSLDFKLFSALLFSIEASIISQ